MSSSNNSGTSNSTTDDKLTDVTNNTDSDQCHLTSFETDTTLSSVSSNNSGSASSQRSNNGLPPPNARHTVPEKMVRITNREKSPYRLMPADVLKNRKNMGGNNNNGGGQTNNSTSGSGQQHQHYLSAGSSPASSLGKCSIYFLYVSMWNVEYSNPRECHFSQNFKVAFFQIYQ